jgi:hypothetical protein
MKRIVDPSANPGELLHAVLEGLVVAEISDATLSPVALAEPLSESRRGRGIKSVRASEIARFERLRAGR